ncbi:MAG: histidine kinase dimerization/phospho-acceptor domain-containing protein, partial [Candidatus Uhrbacteria bacterium]
MSETLQKKLFQRIRVNWLAIIFIAFILLFLIAIDVQFSWKGLVVFFGLAVVANLIRELLVGRMIALKTIAWLGPVWDILLITCVVYFTGGHDSIFGFLYLVPIISVSVMLSAEKGIIFSILSSLLFSTLVMLEFRGIIPFTSIVGDRAYVRIDNVYLVITILLNRFLVFFIVASVSGYLAESLKQKMNEADEVKNEFVSLVSHQLKTPLSIFKLYLEELLSQRLGKINKDQKEYLDEMQHNNENLICLVSDLL